MDRDVNRAPERGGNPTIRPRAESRRKPGTIPRKIVSLPAILWYKADGSPKNDPNAAPTDTGSGDPVSGGVKMYEKWRFKNAVRIGV